MSELTKLKTAAQRENPVDVVIEVLENLRDRIQQTIDECKQ